MPSASSSGSTRSSRSAAPPARTVRGSGPASSRPSSSSRAGCAKAGLDVTFDPAGNVVGRLPGSEPELPEVWSGSHLDTPPDGGRFDGALGTLLALDAAEAIGAGDPPRRTVAAMAFRLEEGPRFGRGVLRQPRGVRARSTTTRATSSTPTGSRSRRRSRRSATASCRAAGWLDPPPAAFVEAHIEQGPTLAAMRRAARRSSRSIAGMAGLEITFSGRRGHAGTVQMQLRSDALGAAARLVVDAHDVARSLPGAVATIGRLTVAPGATNTIPERAELFADLRAPDDERVEALVDGVVAAARAAAAAARCEVVVEQRWRYAAVAMSDGPRGALARAVAALGVEPVELPSGAGHDAAILALAGVPSAMLFVRSDAGGVSHAPEEATGIDAVVLAVQALEGALRELAAA